MGWMFYGCHKLKEIKGLNNFNTSKVTIMTSFFEECKEMKNLQLSNFNTSNVTDMSYMFYGCHNLKEINQRNK